MENEATDGGMKGGMKSGMNGGTNGGMKSSMKSSMNYNAECDMDSANKGVDGDSIGGMKGGMKGGTIGGMKGGTNGGMNMDTEEAVFTLICNNNHISISQISETFGISRSAIQKHIEKLKTKDMIKRIGPDRGGYWKILSR